MAFFKTLSFAGSSSFLTLLQFPRYTYKHSLSSVSISFFASALHLYFQTFLVFYTQTLIKKFTRSVSQPGRFEPFLTYPVQYVSLVGHTHTHSTLTRDYSSIATSLCCVSVSYVRISATRGFESCQQSQHCFMFSIAHSCIPHFYSSRIQNIN